MKLEIKKTNWPSILSSIVILVLGLLLFFKSKATLITISYIIGGILIAVGVIAIFRFIKDKDGDSFNQLNIVYGIISILAAIFFIKEPEMIGSIIPVVLGIGIIISSSIKVQQALILRNLNNQYWISSIIISILSLVCGVVLLFNPFKGAVIITKIIGLFLIIYAILDLVNITLLTKSTKISLEKEDLTREKKSTTKTRNARIIKEVEHKESSKEE